MWKSAVDTKLSTKLGQELTAEKCRKAVQILMIFIEPKVNEDKFKTQVKKKPKKSIPASQKKK